MLKQLWLSVRSNPYFVAGWTGFTGAIASQLYIMQGEGHWDFSRSAITKMLIAAAGVAATSVFHLLMPAPGTNPTPAK